jgi:WD40 repeat protein
MPFPSKRCLNGYCYLTVIVLITIMFAAACAPAPTPAPTATLAPTEIPSPTNTLAPTATATPTMTPTPTPIPPTPTPTPLKPSIVISSSNAAQLAQLAVFGKGGPASIAWSPDGKWFAIGAGMGVDLYETKTWKQERFFELDINGLAQAAVAFSPDSQLVAATSRSGAVRLWDISSGRELRTLIGHPDAAYSVAFSPDGKMLASGACAQFADLRCIAGEIRVWQVATGREIYKLSGYGDAVTSVAFSPDGNLLLSGADTVKLWDMRNGAEARTLSGAGPAIFSPDGYTIAMGAGNENIRLWEPSGMRELRAIGGYKLSGLAFSPDGGMLVSGETSFDTVLQVWDVKSGSELFGLPGDRSGPRSAAFSPDGKLLACATAAGVKMWDVASRQEVHTFNDYKQQLTGLAVSQDGQLIAAGFYEGTIKVWRIATGVEILSINAGGIYPYQINFSMNGKWLTAIVNPNGGVAKVWEIGTGQQIFSMGQVFGLAFTPDGKSLATWQPSTGGLYKWENGPIKIWDVETGRELRQFRFPYSARGYYGKSMTFSEDGKTLGVQAQYSSGGAYTVMLWDVAQGDISRYLDISNDYIAFSHDFRLIASSSFQTPIIHVKEAASEREVLALPWSTRWLSNLAFSPDNRLLAAVGRPRTAVWDIPSGREMISLNTDSSKVVFSPDGKLLVLGGSDGVVRVWGIK